MVTIIVVILLYLLFSFPVFNKILLARSNYSVIIIILTLFVWTSILSSYPKIIYSPNYLYIIILTIILLRVLLFFILTNLILIYIIFETRLVIILIMIIGWGYQIERIQARTYLLFYTLLGSFPLLLIFIILISFKSGSIFLQSSIWVSNLIIVILIMAFIIKFPVYFLHLWLPKAHVESPTSGSIILARILLKIGSYGVYRIIQLYSNLSIIYIIIIIISIGRVLRVLVCIFQRDRKSLIAYSSVNHITIMIWSIFTIIYTGIKGSLILILRHGLISTLLFWLVGALYDIYKSRMIFFIQGIILSIPIISGVSFLILRMNFSIPPALRVYRELIVINRIINWDLLSIISLRIIIIGSCYYCLILYSYIRHNKPISYQLVIKIIILHFNDILIYIISILLLMIQLIIII